MRCGTAQDLSGLGQVNTMSTEKNSIEQQLAKYSEDLRKGMLTLIEIPPHTSNRKRLILICLVVCLFTLVLIARVHAPFYYAGAAMVMTLITMRLMWMKDSNDQRSG